MPTQTELFLEKTILYISKYCLELNFLRSLSKKINQYKKSQYINEILQQSDKRITI